MCFQVDIVLQYDIVQANSYKVLGLLLLLSLAITSTLMQIVPIISRLSV